MGNLKLVLLDHSAQDYLFHYHRHQQLDFILKTWASRQKNTKMLQHIMGFLVYHMYEFLEFYLHVLIF